MEKKTIFLVYSYFKGRVRDFWQPMLIFEITKTNTPLPQKGLVPILISPPYTYTYTQPRQRLCKSNVTHLSRRNNATSASDRRPSRSFSSLQHWKADPIFTLLTLSQHSPNPVLAPLALHISYGSLITYHVCTIRP